VVEEEEEEEEAAAAACIVERFWPEKSQRSGIIYKTDFWLSTRTTGGTPTDLLALHVRSRNGMRSYSQRLRRAFRHRHLL
jgi:hypothetical protein